MIIFHIDPTKRISSHYIHVGDCQKHSGSLSGSLLDSILHVAASSLGAQQRSGGGVGFRGLLWFSGSGLRV